MIWVNTYAHIQTAPELNTAHRQKQKSTPLHKENFIAKLHKCKINIQEPSD